MPRILIHLAAMAGLAQPVAAQRVPALTDSLGKV